jgi:hypothetical protein|tara:strand:- start:27 stop:608 length:582 start_codon:yes stop_codon:yes gene_type:complete
MANASTTGFGFRPIKKIAQNYNSAGLSEYSVAASSALISHAALCKLTGDGVVLASGNTDVTNLGTLNGVFYTDATTSKPTWSNYSPASNTATDIVAFINDDPMQMFEVMSADTAFNQNEVGHCADQVLEAGSSPLYMSKSKISATTANTQAQLFILGVSRDPDHMDTAAEGFALRVQIREHILIGQNTQRAGI